MRTFSPKQIAAHLGVHSNTVRLYERLGFISPASRQQNGYRVYDEMHVIQMRIGRSIFGHPFTSRAIREAGNDVLHATAARNWAHARVATAAYLKTIENEIQRAKITSDALVVWAGRKEGSAQPQHDVWYTRPEAATYIGTTVESIRNWERNGLLESSLNTQGKRVYDQQVLEKMRIIYMLRQAGYSMSAIHRSLAREAEGSTDVTAGLESPREEDVVWVGDSWMHELKKILESALHIPVFIDELEKTF